jgi:nucleoid DNA-binding protein
MANTGIDGNRMTKTQLIEILAASCGTTKKAARNLVDTLASTAVTEVKKNGVFVLRGIGRLVRIDRPPDAPVDAPPNGSKVRIAEIEVPPPKVTPKDPKLPKGPRTAVKTDWSANDAANRGLGLQGEKFVFDLERHHLNEIGRADLAKDVEWTAKDRGDGLGYDIRSFDDNGREMFIEVKTTNGPKAMPFLLTATELACSAELKNYWIYRLYHFGSQVRFFRIRGPVAKRLHLQPKVYSATSR